MTGVAEATTPIRYALEGTLADGGEFFGSFTIDPLASDESATPLFGEFQLVDVSLHAINTPLFTVSGLTNDTSGSTNTGQLFQDGTKQTLQFTFLGDSGLSNVFTDGLSFSPFTGDPDTAAAIEGPYLLGGFFDGNGGSNILTATVTVVPEPSSILLMGLGAIVGLRRVRALN